MADTPTVEEEIRALRGEVHDLRRVVRNLIIIGAGAFLALCYFITRADDAHGATRDAAGDREASAPESQPRSHGGPEGSAAGLATTAAAPSEALRIRVSPRPASRDEQRQPIGENHADKIGAEVTPTPPAGFGAWLASSMSHSVRTCESDMDYRIVDVNDGVTYYGAWQANEDFWRTYGGDPVYLGPAPFTAPRGMQDRVAYRGYLARGWQPWACA